MRTYNVVLTGQSGDETVIAEGTNKRTVMREAREYLKYSDVSLNRSEIKKIVDNGLIIC